MSVFVLPKTLSQIISINLMAVIFPHVAVKFIAQTTNCQNGTATHCPCGHDHLLFDTIVHRSLESLRNSNAIGQYLTPRLQVVDLFVDWSLVIMFLKQPENINKHPNNLRTPANILSLNLASFLWDGWPSSCSSLTSKMLACCQKSASAWKQLFGCIRNKMPTVAIHFDQFAASDLLPCLSHICNIFLIIQLYLYFRSFMHFVRGRGLQKLIQESFSCCRTIGQFLPGQGTAHTNCNMPLCHLVTTWYKLLTNQE